jgi:hypothetical protein
MRKYEYEQFGYKYRKYEYEQFGYKSKSISSHVQSNQSISRTSSNNLKFLRTKCYAQSNQPPPPPVTSWTDKLKIPNTRVLI